MRGGLRAAVLGMALAGPLWGAGTVVAVPMMPRDWAEPPAPGQRETMPPAPGELDAAHASFERLRQADPLAPSPYIGLAEVAMRKDDLAAAEAYLRQGIAATPRAPQLHRALGRVHAAQGRAEDAVADFNEAIRLAPDLPAAYLEIADLLSQRLGQPDRALPFYESVLSRDPGNGVARYGRALALARTGEPGRAMAELNEAARLLPDSPVPDYARARLLMQTSQPLDALTALEAALMRQPGFIAARIAKAGLLQSMGRKAEALALYDAALQQDPGSINALLGLGMVLQMDGQLSGAAVRYRTVLAIEPENAVAMNNLAWLAAVERRGLDDALSWSRRAVASAPEEAAFADTLGWVLHQRGELQEAEVALARAVALRPGADTLTRLAAVRAELGRKAEAKADVERALQLDPGYLPAREELARLQQAPAQ